MRAPRAAVLVLAALALLALSARAEAQATSASLTLQQVFGRPATALAAPFGLVDAQCLAAPAAGISCQANAVAVSATWYGPIQFSVSLGGGVGNHTVRLTGVRQAGGSLPAGRLVDGPGGVPATAYPIAPSAPIALASAIGKGTTTVVRSLGVRVQAADTAATWTTAIVYSLVVE